MRSVDDATPTLRTTAIDRFDELDEPHKLYGTLVRRPSDYATTAEIAKRLGGSIAPGSVKLGW